MFSELSVTCMCSLQFVVSLDKNDLNLIFPDEWERMAGVRDLGKKKKNILEP